MSTPEHAPPIEPAPDTLFIRGEVLVSLVQALGPLSAKKMALLLAGSEEEVTYAAQRMVDVGYLSYDGIAYWLCDASDQEGAVS